MSDDLKRFREMARLAEAGGGPEAAARQHASGKLTARERVARLLDPGSFSEMGRFVTHECRDFGMERQRPFGDGVVTGFGTIEGRKVAVFAHDYTALGGSVGYRTGLKIARLMDVAGRTGTPFIGLNDTGGARIQEGINSLQAFTEIMRRNVKYSGVVPQISAIMGPCTGGSAYSAALNDVLIMVRGTSHMYITGPEVARLVLGEESTHEDLGGADMHASVSGSAHLVADTDEECLSLIRDVFSYLPSSREEAPPRRTGSDRRDRRDPDLDRLVPDEAMQPFDMSKLVTSIVDDGRYLELQPQYARNMITALARLDGYSVGIVANQPMHRAGCLDIHSSRKAARFVRFCSCFSVPVLNLVDVPGYMPGREQEQAGVVVQGAKLVAAFAEPFAVLSLVVRKCHGGAHVLATAGDIVLAWPSARIQVMGTEGAVRVLHAKELAAAADPEAVLAERRRQYESLRADGVEAERVQYVDRVIEPSRTREEAIAALEILRSFHRDPGPQRRFGNIPL